MGVRRVILWGNSTGGLAVTSYLRARAAAPPPPGMRTPELVLRGARLSAAPVYPYPYPYPHPYP